MRSAPARIGRRLFAVLFAAALLPACGRTYVTMNVIEPAVISPKPYGGSVSVEAFRAPRPDWAQVSGQLRAEVQQAILAEMIPGSVQLRDFGGGLQVSGTIENYGFTVERLRRKAKCHVKRKRMVGDMETTETDIVDCEKRRLKWTANATVRVEVNSAAGQKVYIDVHSATRTGKTPEADNRWPPPPNPHPILQALRGQLAAEIAHVVVPHRRHVTETLYDCEKRAKSACAAGAAHLARSAYEQAEVAYRDAIELARRGRQERAEIAKIWWNLAIVFKYSRQFEAGETALAEAIRLDPGDGSYRNEIRRMRAARERHRKLLDQGLGPAPRR